MGECEKVGKMRFYPKPAAWPELLHRIATDRILPDTSPFFLPRAPRATRRAGACTAVAAATRDADPAPRRLHPNRFAS